MLVTAANITAIFQPIWLTFFGDAPVEGKFQASIPIFVGQLQYLSHFSTNCADLLVTLLEDRFGCDIEVAQLVLFHCTQVSLSFR